MAWNHPSSSSSCPQAHETLSSQATGETRYFSKKKTLLALSKLTALASDMDQTQLSRHLEGRLTHACMHARAHTHYLNMNTRDQKHQKRS